MHSSVPFSTSETSGHHKLFHYDNFQDISERSFTRFHKGCLFQSETGFMRTHERHTGKKKKKGKGQKPNNNIGPKVLNIIPVGGEQPLQFTAFRS